MACTLFTLAQQPELAERLRKALEPHVPSSPDTLLMDDQIMDVDLLNGVIYEALRMYPPSPSHPTRVTPPEGTIIAGQFIPGRTQLITPQYVIGRGTYFISLSPKLPFCACSTDTSARRRTRLSPRQRIHSRALVQPSGARQR